MLRKGTNMDSQNFGYVRNTKPVSFLLCRDANIHGRSSVVFYTRLRVYHPIANPLSERVHHVVQCAFNGRRIVIFSGGPIDSDDAFLNEVRAIHAGHGFGSIIGRNSFQRSKPDALRLLNTIMDIYSGQSETIRTPVLT